MEVRLLNYVNFTKLRKRAARDCVNGQGEGRRG